MERHPIETMEFWTACDDVDALREALDAGLDPDARPRGVATLAMLCACSGAERCLKLLLSRGADARAYGPDAEANMQGAHAAAAHGRLARLEALLAHGADPDAVAGRAKTTPLILAILNREAECAELLMRHGADPRLNPGAGPSPSERARREGMDATADLIAQRELQIMERAEVGHVARPAGPGPGPKRV